MPAGWNPEWENPVPGDVIACLNELGVHIKRVDESTDEVIAWCPAHVKRTGKQDRHPSWSVNTESGKHNCFSCGFSGSFATLVKEVRDCSRGDAVLWIKQRGGIERVRRAYEGGRYIDDLREEEEITEADLALYLLPPLDVLKARNIDPEAADDYEILWDDEHDRWIFPIRDPHTGKLWGWQEKSKRVFINVPKELTKSHTLFGIRHNTGVISTAGILVESPLDCARIRSVIWDGAEVVSSMGAKVSDAQLDILCERYDVLISALDNDAAGDESNATLRDRIGGRVRLKFWEYGDSTAKDPGEQSDAEIEYAIKNAVSSTLVRW